MMLFNFQIELAELDGPSLMKGSFELREGEKQPVICHLPEGSLRSVTASAPLHLAEGEKIFMNGYQTRTYCPEYAAQDVIRPRAPLPRHMVERLHLDRCGDYHFVDYAARPGMFHGFSYCYFRYRDTYRLIASLDERPGYTIFRYDAGKGELSVERDCEGLRCDGDFHAFDLFYAVGAEDEVFDAWFEAMDVHALTEKKLAGYTSWYDRYRAINEQTILDDLNGCAELLEKEDLFAIDDGWETFVGDWLEPDEKKFPNGLRNVVAAIHEKGLKAGLWLAPFAAQEGSLLLREHPDWCLLHEGKRWACGGGRGGIYAMDIDHPGFMRYLEWVFRRVFDEWGFDLVKLDCLYAAAPFGSELESRAGRMIRVMERLRELCGYKQILACGVPLMPAFGRVEYCRVGCDVTLDWDDKPWMRLVHRERPSTRQALGNAIFRRQLNGRAFLNDPAVFFLRNDNVKLTMKQKNLLATLDAVTGGVLLHSDDMSRYGEEGRKQYRALRHLRNAQEVRFSTDGHWMMYCTLDDTPYEMPLEGLP